jgi:hypothetical protein
MIHGTIGRILAVAGLGLAAGSARAQIAYEFADISGAPQSSFTINGIGGNVQIRVYLHDLSSGASELNSQGGLATAGVRVTYNNPGGFAAVQSSSDVTGAIPPWSSSTTNGSNFSQSAVLNLFSPFSGGVLPDSNGRVFLGTFTFHGLAPGVETIGAVDPNPGTNFDTTHFNGGVGIDSQLVSGAATINVSPVPEPTVLFAATAGLGLFGRMLSRRTRSGQLSLAN